MSAMNVMMLGSWPLSRTELDSLDEALADLCKDAAASGYVDARAENPVGLAVQYRVSIDLTGAAALVVADEPEARFPALQRFLAW